MTFTTKFKTTIQNWDGDTITAEIQEDGFAGTVQEFTPIGGSPITIEHQCNVNVKESYIIPSMATVGVYVNYDWDLVELLYANDRDLKLIITNTTDSRVLFTGWVIPGVNKEEYTTGRYRVMIQAIDGLADLKNIPYLNSGALYDAYRYPSVIISDCLLATGITLGFWENCDIYAASGMTTTATTHSPLNQSYIHTKAYGDTVDNVLSCFDVLEKVLQAFHLRLYQSTELDGGNNTVWVLGKIDKLASTETYREWNSAGTTIASNTSYNPLKTLSTSADPRHVGGPAQILIQQGFKRVDLIADRGDDFSMLQGSNFEDDDFPTAASLSNWSDPDKTDLTSTWTVATVAKTTIDSQTMCGVSSYAPDHQGTNPTVDNGAGKVRFNDTSTPITTSDYIIIAEGDYKGVWKVTGAAVNTFDINADYTEDQSVSWWTVNNLEGIEYNGTGSVIDDVIQDDTDNFLEIEINYNINRMISGKSFVAVVVMAYISGSDYKVINNNGVWADDSTTDFPIIIFDHQDGDIGDFSQKITASLDGSFNFYTAGSPKLYIGLYGNPINTPVSDNVFYNNVSLSVKTGNNKEVSTIINTDYVEVKDLKFFHTDGDGSDNDEFLYINSIRDDATPKALVNLWSQDGGDDDTIEDIVHDNLVVAYGDNSQIWSGTIKGDINISHAIKDPLNFDRIFQIQRINRNLVNDFNSLSMIEITPAGEPTFALSISAPGTLEIDKGRDETGSKFATITNTGNALVSLSCVLSGGDTSHFEIIGTTEFELPVGKSQVIELKAVTGDAVGGYASNIVISETRAYRTMTSKTIEIGHLNTNATILISNNVSNAQIVSIVGGVTVNTNSTGGIPNPTSKVITGIFGQSIHWQVNCTQTGPSGAGGTMRLSTGGPIVESRTLSNPSNLSVTIVPDLHSYIASGAWNGAAQLTYTLV